jgi:hypothetical protein
MGFSAPRSVAPSVPCPTLSSQYDGLVKSPSAALRFNPAPLDKKPHSWEAGMKLLIFEGKNHFEKYLPV